MLQIKKYLPTLLLFFFTVLVSSSLNLIRADDPVLFFDGFEEDSIPFQYPDYAWKPVQLGAEAQIVGSPARSGGHAVQFTLDYDDPWYLPASQWRLNNPSDVHHFELGSTYWYGFSINLPAGFAVNNQTEIVNEFLGTPDFDLGESWERDAPVSLMLDGPNWQFSIRSDADVNSSDKSYDTYRSWNLGSWQDGRWTDWVYHIKWSYADDGFIQVWQDGTLVVDYSGPTTFNDKQGPFWKMGIYEWTWSNEPTAVRNRTVYFDEFRVTNQDGTYADVVPGERDDDGLPPIDTDALIQIFAAGRDGTETMELIIDGTVVASYADVGGDYFNGIYETYSYEYDTAVSPEQVRVNFSNDVLGRDLRVDKITINGVAYESEDAYSTGAWNESDGCTEGYVESEYLFCNGFFEYQPALNDPEHAIFVSPDGNDANDGTLERPYSTIQKAVDLVTPGKTIYLRGGTYIENVIMTQSGTEDAPITLKAYPGEQPVIDGQYVLPYGTPVNCNETVSPPKCFIYNPLLKIEGSYIIVQGLEITGSRGRGITVTGEDGVRPRNVKIAGCQIHHVRNAAISIIDATHVVVQGCEVHHAADYATHSRQADVLNWPVIVNTVRAHDVTLTQNNIHENYGEGIAAGRDSTEIRIVDNKIYNNYAMQIYVHRSQEVVVANNLVYHTNAPAFWRGGNPSQCIVINNEPNFVTSQTVKDVAVVNNIVAGCRRNISIWGSGGSGLPIEDVTISHNTLINAVANNDIGAIGLHVATNNSNLEDIRLENNIILQQTGDIAIAPDHPQVEFSHNLWSRTPPATASGGGDIISEPGLEDVYAMLIPDGVFAEWFTPLATSLAIDAGIGAEEEDYFGHERDSYPDIGAIEFDP